MTLPAPANPAEDEFILAATFVFPDAAAVTCGLLRSCGVLFYLENDQTLAKVWPWNIALGGLRLMVPASVAEEVSGLLAPTVSGEVDAAVEESAGSAGPPLSPGLFVHGRTGAMTRVILAFAVLSAPALESLRLLHIAP